MITWTNPFLYFADKRAKRAKWASFGLGLDTKLTKNLFNFTQVSSRWLTSNPVQLCWRVAGRTRKFNFTSAARSNPVQRSPRVAAHSCSFYLSKENDCFSRRIRFHFLQSRLNLSGTKCRLAKGCVSISNIWFVLVNSQRDSDNYRKFHGWTVHRWFYRCNR